MNTWGFIFLGFAFARRLAGADSTLKPCCTIESKSFIDSQSPSFNEIARASGSAGAAPALKAFGFDHTAWFQGGIRACQATSEGEAEEYPLVNVNVMDFHWFSIDFQ